MNIKTITCHDVYNYGASLQAFALQTFLEKNGHSVEIIDYKPDYIDFPYKVSLFVHPHSPAKKIVDKIPGMGLLYGIKRYLWYLPSLKRKQAFDKFTKKYLRLTKTYHSNESLAKDVPDADVYIVGSDQVWNSITMLNGTDPAFYLQFVPSSRKRLSYAASFGSISVSDKYEAVIKQWLSTFNAISVRESSGVELLKCLGINGDHVCDPVFLLSEDEWRYNLNIPQKEEKYVLIYNLTSLNEELLANAKQTAKRMGAKLYSISPMQIKGVDKCFINAGPEQFVSLIFNASFVFTNSFHATAFSIISHRQFCTYNYHSKSNSSRMYSVLAEMDMLDRLNITDINKVIDSPIDYSAKKHLIDTSCNNGKYWLQKNI